MDYSFEQFAALAAEVESQGGGHLTDECAPSVIQYAKPPGDKYDEVNSCHCGNESIFVTVYDPGSEDQRKLGSGFARACAVCDSMGAWPRYAAAMEVE